MTFKTARITTEDKEFSKELLNLDIPGVEVFTRMAADISIENIVEHIIKFASSIAVRAFSVWLSERIKKKTPDKSTMNGQQISIEIDKIIVIINGQPESEDEDADQRR